MKKLLPILFITILTLYLIGCNQDKPVVAEQWQEIELNFTSEGKYQNPYTEVEFWVEFTEPGGKKLVRPGFWYDKSIWKVDLQILWIQEFGIGKVIHQFPPIKA